MDFKHDPDANFRPIGDMKKGEAREEVEALREGIHYHDFLYYTRNEPEISDALYDKLFHRLEDLEEAFPDLRSDDSPTQRVGAEPLDGLQEAKHTRPMLSLKAVMDAEDVRGFLDFVEKETGKEGIAYTLEPKFDGLSVELVYEEGRFRRAATRGDGERGEDISRNVKTIKSVPLQLQPNGVPSFLAVRGEIFMPKSAFQSLNAERVEQGQDPFANARNAAAGIMRHLDPARVGDKPLDIFVYDILEVRNGRPGSHWEALGRLTDWGFKTEPNRRRAKGLKAIQAFHGRMADRRDALEYDIDGIVIKVDGYGVRDVLGSRRRSPRWALAWKFQPREEVTTLKKIVVQVGRTGILTPVALLDPVEVGGVTVSRATLHNEDEVQRKDLRPGDVVRVVRAGDVIPEVLERVPRRGRKRSSPFSMPGRCPACGAEVTREGAYCLCPAGLSCPPQLAGRVVHYGSREALDIEGLGRKTAEALVQRELVKDIASLYELSLQQIGALEGFAGKSARQLHDAIQGSKEPEFRRFLYGLGIRHVGERVAGILSKRFGTLERLSQAEPDALQGVAEVGPEISRSVRSFFREEQNRAVLERLRDAGVKVRKASGGRGDQPLEGRTIVFTGRLASYTRSEAERLVEDLGGRATSSVSGETDYVVAGEGSGQKLEEAKEAGVAVLDEQRFEKLLGKG